MHFWRPFCQIGFQSHKVELQPYEDVYLSHADLFTTFHHPQAHFENQIPIHSEIANPIKSYAAAVSELVISYPQRDAIPGAYQAMKINSEF